MVTDRPSSTQAEPSPMTRRVWKGVHRKRSSRAGIVLRMGCWGRVGTVGMQPSLLAGCLFRTGCGAVFACLVLPVARVRILVGRVAGRHEHDRAPGPEQDVLAFRPWQKSTSGTGR